MAKWDEGYCPDCGAFLGDLEHLEEHWCPFLDDFTDDGYTDDGYDDDFDYGEESTDDAEQEAFPTADER